MADNKMSMDSQESPPVDIEKIEKTELSILPLKSAVVCPSLVMPLMITEARYAKLIDEALMAGEPIILGAQKDADVEFAGPDDIYNVGTAGSILKMLRFPDGSVRFLAQGIARVKIKKVTQTEPYMKCFVEVIAEEMIGGVEEEALVRNIHEQLKKVVQLRTTFYIRWIMNTASIEFGSRVLSRHRESA